MASVEEAKELFYEGVGQYRAGDYPAAESNFRRALELTGPRPSVLTNLANALLAQGRTEEAAGFAQRSVELDDASADGWFVLGRCLQRDPERALECFDRAIALRSDWALARSLRADLVVERQRLERYLEALKSSAKVSGLVEAAPPAPKEALLIKHATSLLAEGKGAEALAQANAALALAPDSAQAWYVRASALSRLNRQEDAQASYRQSVQLDPSLAAAWQDLGVTLCLLNRHRESLACFDRVIQLAPNHVDAWLNRGIAHFSLGEADDAMADFDQGLAREPLNVELTFNRGVVFAASARHEDALVCYDRCLQINPRYAEAWNNRGICLKALLKLDEALACHENAIECSPDYADAWTNRGWLLYESKRYQESLASYESALQIDPDHADAHWNEALARLLLGQFELGWKKYAYRWKIHAAALPHRAERRLTRLEDAGPGSQVLLWAEQGYGDTIQFCRYAHELADRGARVFVEVQPALKELLGSLGVHGVFAQGDLLPAFDLHAALLDMPALFGTTATNIPAPASYLKAHPAWVAQWSARLPPRDGKPRIGICCSGSARHPGDRARSMPLAGFACLCEHAQLFLVQKELRDSDAAFLRHEPRIHFVGDQLESFSDSAALVASMDLVISVDTSLAHLAGALGKKVWILLPWAPEWRWMLDRADCPWYPSATLFRQDAAGDWDRVMQRVIQELNAHPHP